MNNHQRPNKGMNRTKSTHTAVGLRRLFQCSTGLGGKTQTAVAD